MVDDKGLALFKAILGAKRGFERISEFGRLTQGEYLVLRRVRIEQERKEGIGMFKAVRISEYLSMPPPAVSRLFNALEKKGLIERKINPSNRRSVLIDLTDSGREALMLAEKRISKFALGLIDELGNQETERLILLLGRVESYCNKVGEISNEKSKENDME